jgi:hypothetical protein
MTMFEQFEEIRRRVTAIEHRLNSPLPAANPGARSTAPVPDYRSERPAEVDACSCEESEALRADLRVTLEDLNRKIGLLGEARADNERLRVEAQGERDKTARAHKALRDREAAELAALHELDEQTALLSQAQADAKEDGDSVLALVVALAEAREEIERLRAKRRERDDMWHRRQENWRASSERIIRERAEERDAANALLDRLRRVVGEAYTLPNRAKFREHAWRYLDLMRDTLAEPEAAKEEPNQNHR